MEKTQAIIEKINQELTELIKDSMRYGASEAAALEDVWIMTLADLHDVAYKIKLEIQILD